MNYKLNLSETNQEKGAFRSGLQKLLPLLEGEKRTLSLAFLAILVTTTTTLAGPFLIGYTIDHFIAYKNFHGVLLFSLLLGGVYLLGALSNYVQSFSMGSVGRRVLFKLRNALFTKIQELPIAFFNQNKSGDLISRINSDTDKLNQFFAQALIQFIGGVISIIGTGIFLLVLDPVLGAATLVPAVLVLVITQIISPWVQRKNLSSLQTLGSMSGEIQESLKNFKVMIAFNRLDYFRAKFHETNEKNYRASIGAGIANNLFGPLYDFAYDLGQLIVLVYGIYLITTGHFTVGLLISFLLYATNFYNPLRQFASVWSSLQLALAALSRVSEILALTSDMQILPSASESSAYLMEFRDVSFRYPDSEMVLRHVNLALQKGKTYALVGPTGGGKTTTASLMARLYDPTEGNVVFEGKDIRSYPPEERAQKIGFILQEPLLFTGTLGENIVYGNPKYQAYSEDELREELEKEKLSNLLTLFPEGLNTKISSSGETISLGQKQLIAFIRAVLRAPDLLILDEATANIDTVTEQLLEEILSKLPSTTTKVVIAHRLNTINDADEIYFVNSGEVTLAGSMQNAVYMLLHGKRSS